MRVFVLYLSEPGFPVVKNGVPPEHVSNCRADDVGRFVLIAVTALYLFLSL